MKNWLLNIQSRIVVDTPTSEFTGNDAYVDIPSGIEPYHVIFGSIIGFCVGIIITLLAIWLFKKR